MSTRSLICKENIDHTYTGIYCHWDGYPDHNGQLLVKHYSDRNKVDDLLRLGSLSVLAEEIAPPPGVNHTFDAPIGGVCVAYHRDRGEDYEEPSLVTFDSYKKSWCEYLYVFGLDGKWRYFDTITDDHPTPKEFTEEWAQGYYEQPSPSGSKCNLTIDDIINGVDKLDDYSNGDGDQGFCPRCGEIALEYGEKKFDGEAVVFPWKCSHCGATGKEVYSLAFVGHYHDDE